MMKNYLKPLLFLSLVLSVSLTVFSQNRLENSQYGTLIEGYLNVNKEKLNLQTEDISDLLVTNEYLTKNTKVTHVYVNQRYHGVKIFNALSSVAIKNGRVSYYANNFISQIEDKINTQSATLSPENAIQNVATRFNLNAPQNLSVLAVSGKKFIYSNGSISQENIPVEQVYVLHENELKLAWDLSVYTNDSSHWWSVRVDATSGDILEFNDWVVSCNFSNDNHSQHNHTATALKVEESFSLFNENYLVTDDGSQYNVFPLPEESPIHGDRALLTNPSDDTASPYGWHDTNGVMGAEFSITRGNNVWAQEDANGNNGFGLSANGTASLNFDFDLNLNQEPSGYQEASLTNLFYMNNVMHDIWYHYGFDEAAGNFQQNNYNNGGLGNDYVFADGQDGSSLNNANFSTPADGSNPRMQMFLWQAIGLPTPLTINNTDLAGGYVAATPATGVGNNITGPSDIPVTADLVLVNDGTINPTEGCSALINASNVAGKIAVIKRGNCPFVDKIQNAQNAGAVGVIMVNHNNPDNDPEYVEYVNMAGQSNPAFTIPSIFVNNADGEQIIAALMANQSINATIVNNGPFDRDGSFDNGIIAHEYGHGISNRLTGGPSAASCLTNREQMGEGWSDWFGLMLTMKAGDSPEVGKGIAVFANGEGTDGIGIRPAKYSTDFAVNGFTYDATNDDTVLGTDANGNIVRWNDSQHNIGFVWATMLWDLTWAYIDKYGFDPDLYNGTGGNNKVMQIVMDGLKLQPCGPGFVDGRDAILQADMILTGGEDQCLIWEVFAARGLGVNASQGASFSMTDQVEDFNMPLDTDPSLSNCTSLSVDEFNTSDYKVYPNPANDVLYIKTSKNFGEVTVTVTDINGRRVLSKQTQLSGQIEINISNLQTGIYILNINGDSLNANNKIIKK